MKILIHGCLHWAMKQDLIRLWPWEYKTSFFNSALWKIRCCLNPKAKPYIRPNDSLDFSCIFPIFINCGLRNGFITSRLQHREIMPKYKTFISLGRIILHTIVKTKIFENLIKIQNKTVLIIHSFLNKLTFVWLPSPLKWYLWLFFGK